MQSWVSPRVTCKIRPGLLHINNTQKQAPFSLLYGEDAENYYLQAFVLMLPENKSFCQIFVGPIQSSFTMEWLTFFTTTSWQCILRSAVARSIRFMVYMNSAHLICQGFFSPTSQVFRDLTKYVLKLSTWL